MKDDNDPRSTTESEGDLGMAKLMEHLYFRKKNVDYNNVSIHSAFICVLHLANERSLAFHQEDTATESDFNILLGWLYSLLVDISLEINLITLILFIQKESFVATGDLSEGVNMLTLSEYTTSDFFLPKLSLGI